MVSSKCYACVLDVCRPVSSVDELQKQSRYYDHGVRYKMTAGVRVQQRVLELFSDFFGIYSHVVVAVGVLYVVFRLNVQSVGVRLVPFVRRVYLQLNCKKKCFYENTRVHTFQIIKFLSTVY